MTPARARPLLHAVHLVTAALLLATGMLLLFPGLRAEVTGGHALVIRDAHRWGGVAFAALPALILARAGMRSLHAAPAAGTTRALWRGVHVGITVVTGAAFTLTGAAIWAARLAPDGVVDAARSVHDGLTWALIALVAVHLAAVGAAQRRAPAAAGPAPAPSPER
jgi:hypothetical protein